MFHFFTAKQKNFIYTSEMCPVMCELIKHTSIYMYEWVKTEAYGNWKCVIYLCTYFCFKLPWQQPITDLLLGSHDLWHFYYLIFLSIFIESVVSVLFYLVHNCLGMYGLLVQVIRYLISIWVHDCLRNKHKAKSNYKAVCSVDCTKKTKKELIKNESIKWPYFEAYKLHSLPTLQTFTPSPKSPCILYSEGHIWSQYWDQ